MSENITSRVGRLLSGTVNSMVDAVENMAPEIVMEQAIREMGQAITDIRAELGKEVAQKHMLSKRIEDEQKRHQDIFDKIELALSEKRDDLAESAVGKILDIESQIPVLKDTLVKNEGRIEELEGFIEALDARKREMKEELKDFRAAQISSQANSGDGTYSESTVDNTISKAEEVFDRVMESSTGINLENRNRDAETAKKMAELDDLARQSKIKDRLAAFKSSSK